MGCCCPSHQRPPEEERRHLTADSAGSPVPSRGAGSSDVVADRQRREAVGDQRTLQPSSLETHNERMAAARRQGESFATIVPDRVSFATVPPGRESFNTLVPDGKSFATLPAVNSFSAYSRQPSFATIAPDRSSFATLPGAESFHTNHGDHEHRPARSGVATPAGQARGHPAAGAGPTLAAGPAVPVGPGARPQEPWWAGRPDAPTRGPPPVGAQRAPHGLR